MEEAVPRIAFGNVSDLLAKPEPKLEWLIENMWVDQSRGLIAGNPGVGKTWLALDMLLSVATGSLCLGRYPAKQAPVLLMEEEASPHNLARRIHCMARARGLKDADLPTFFHATRQYAKLPRDSKEICGFIIQEGIKFVVFDSLRRFHNAEENSSSEMQPVLDAFGVINSFGGASVALIHHLSKSSEVNNKPLFERLRGSSDLWAWRDCIIGVEGEEDADECLASFQFRDAEAQSPIRIKRHVGEVTGAISLEASGIEESEEFIEKSASIIIVMQKHGISMSKELIFKGVKGRKADFVRVFKRMASLKMVAQNGSGWYVPEMPGTLGNTGT